MFFQTRSEAIEKAKQRIMNRYSRTKKEKDDFKTRQWLGCHVDSYEEEEHRISVLVCEGSPVKGIIIVNDGRATVMAFDAWGKRLRSDTYEKYTK